LSSSVRIHKCFLKA